MGKQKGNDGKNSPKTIAQRQAASEATLARKKALQKATLATAEQRRKERADEFAIQCEEALTMNNIADFLDGSIGATAVINLEKGATKGRIITEVRDHGNGEGDIFPVIHVVGSDFGPIPVQENFWMPHSWLKKSDFPAGTNIPRDVRAWQRELYHALRWVAEKNQEELAKARFKDAVRKASSDLSLINDGIVGSTVAVNLEKDGASGTVLIEVGRNFKTGTTIIQVIGSDFGPIPARSDVFLSHSTLGFNEPKRVVKSDAQFAWQCELHTALRWAIKKAGDSPKKQSWAKQDDEPLVLIIKAPSSSSTKMEPKVEPLESKPKLRATKLQGIHLNEKFGEMQSLFFHTNSDGTAWFRREKVAGARKLTLINATDDHRLSPLLDEHKEVQVDYAAFKQKSTQEIGDLHDVRNARLAVAKYILERVLPECGYNRPDAQSSMVIGRESE